MTVTGPQDDVVKELVDADVPRVDAVEGPAHGLPFLMLKSAGEQPAVLQVDPAAVVKATDTLPVAIEVDPAALGQQAEDDAAGLPVPTDHPGDPDAPGSPAWEAIDAARARGAVQALQWLMTLVRSMGDREAAEANAGAESALDRMYDLGDVLDSLDCALAVMAKFAVDEQGEADARAAEVEDEARAMGLIKALDQMPTSELRKAGRVLSAANLASVSAAIAALQDVLSAATPAPAQEAPMDQQQTSVEKADGASATDTLHSTISKLAKACGCAACVGWVASSRALGSAAADSGGDVEDDAAVEAPAPAENTAPDLAAAPAPSTSEEEPVVKAQDQDPAPAGDVVPGPAAGSSNDQSVLLKSLAEVVEAAVAPLRDRLAAVEEQPMPGGPLLSGATPAAPVTKAAAEEQADPFAGVRKALDAEPNPTVRATAAAAAVNAVFREHYAPVKAPAPASAQQ